MQAVHAILARTIVGIWSLAQVKVEILLFMKIENTACCPRNQSENQV